MLSDNGRKVESSEFDKFMCQDWRKGFRCELAAIRFNLNIRKTITNSEEVEVRHPRQYIAILTPDFKQPLARVPYCCPACCCCFRACCSHVCDQVLLMT